MDFSHHFHDGILIVEISDGLMGQLCSDIDTFIHDIVSTNDKSSNTIALDLSKKNFLNSSGLSDLLRTKDRLSDEGLDLVLISPSSRVMALLKMIGVNDFFNIIADIKELNTQGQ